QVFYRLNCFGALPGRIPLDLLTQVDQVSDSYQDERFDVTGAKGSTARHDSSRHFGLLEWRNRFVRIDFQVISQDGQPARPRLDKLPLTEGLQPSSRDSRNSPMRAGCSSGPRSDRVGIPAEVDGELDRVFQVRPIEAAPDCRLQAFDNVACVTA